MNERFTKLGEDLKFYVACEFNMPYPLAEELRPLVEEYFHRGLTDPAKEKLSPEDQRVLLANTYARPPIMKVGEEGVRVVRMYEPAKHAEVKNLGSGERSLIVWNGEHRLHSVRHRLMFWRKEWGFATFARHGETQCFGFSCEDRMKKSNVFAHIAYPGITGTFVPLYLRSGHAYYKIDATDGPNNSIVLRFKKVPASEAPAHLEHMSF